MTKKIKYNRNRFSSYYRPQNKSRVKLYCMFAKNLTTGELLGFCNDSFCMSWRKDCVHIWDTLPLHYYRGQPGWTTKCVPSPGWEIFVTRLNSKNCPVVVDLTRHTFKGNYIFRKKEKKEPEEKLKYKYEDIVKCPN